MRIRTLAIALPLFAVSVFGASSLVAQQPLTLDRATAATDAAEAEARRNDWNLTIVVTDADGVPILVRRMDGASPRSYEIAMGKTRTSLAAGMSTGDYGRALADGTADTIPNGITFEGGYLISLGGQTVGAMSASGARGSEDAQAVRIGLAAIEALPRE